MAGLGLLAIQLAPVAYAQCDPPPTNTKEALQCGSSNTSGVPVSDNPESALQSVINDVVNYLSIAVGIIAVIMIVFAGYRYITSGGDASKVASAKTTLIYAIIGLIIVALAQIIVKFVINETTNPSGGGAPTPSQPTPGGGTPTPPPGSSAPG